MILLTINSHGFKGFRVHCNRCEDIIGYFSSTRQANEIMELTGNRQEVIRQIGEVPKPIDICHPCLKVIAASKKKACTTKRQD